MDTIGAGANVTLVAEKVFFDLFYRYQKVDGNNAFTGAEAQGQPEDITDYDDTETNFFSAQVRYRFAAAWSVGLGGFYEKFVLRDSQTGQVLNYMPGSFFHQREQRRFRSLGRLAELELRLRMPIDFGGAGPSGSGAAFCFLSTVHKNRYSILYLSYFRRTVMLFSPALADHS